MNHCCYHHCCRYCCHYYCCYHCYRCRYYVIIIILHWTTLLYNILLSRHLISRLTDITNWWKLRIIGIQNISTNWCRIGIDPVYGQWRWKNAIPAMTMMTKTTTKQCSVFRRRHSASSNFVVTSFGIPTDPIRNSSTCRSSYVAYGRYIAFLIDSIDRSASIVSGTV